MLEIAISGGEFYNEDTNEFVYGESKIVRFEHSLISIAKWESKWQKCYLDEKAEKTEEEFKDYIRCMVITPLSDYSILEFLTQSDVEKIKNYIESPMTATTIKKPENQYGKKAHDLMTAEVIYYWMIASSIPFECEKWHINRLLTLIAVCSEKNKAPQKMDHKTAMSQQRALNQARRAKHHSKG